MEVSELILTSVYCLFGISHVLPVSVGFSFEFSVFSAIAVRTDGYFILLLSLFVKPMDSCVPVLFYRLFQKHSSDSHPVSITI